MNRAQSRITEIRLIGLNIIIVSAVGSCHIGIICLDFCKIILEGTPGPLALLEEIRGVDGLAVLVLERVNRLQHGHVYDQREACLTELIAQQIVAVKYRTLQQPGSLIILKQTRVCTQILKHVLGQNGRLNTAPHQSQIADRILRQHAGHQIRSHVHRILQKLKLYVVGFLDSFQTR